MPTPREEELAKLDALAGEEVTIEPEVDDAEETPEEEPVAEEEAKPEEEKQEVVEKPKLEVKTELPESTGWYKAREEARKREAVEKELEELKRPKIAKEENYEGYIEGEIGATKAELAELKEWRAQQEKQAEDERNREEAFRELAGYESEAAGVFDDFNEAAAYAKSMIAASIKLLEPNISPQDLAQRTIYKYAEHAAIALNAKKHPGQAIYEQAGAWGYKKPEATPPKEVADGRPKIKLETLATNKKKSSGMSGNGSSGKAFPGNDEVFKMTNAERMKLTESDWARLESESV